MDAESDGPGSLAAPRSPGPPRSLVDGKVVPSERKPGDQDAHETSEENVEAVVTEVAEAGGGDIDRCRKGDKRDDQEIGGRRGGLVPKRDGSGSGESVGIVCRGILGGEGVGVVRGVDRGFGPMLLVMGKGTRDGARVGGEGTGGEEGNGNGELGGEEEGQVGEAGE